MQRSLIAILTAFFLAFVQACSSSSGSAHPAQATGSSGEAGSGAQPSGGLTGSSGGATTSGADGATTGGAAGKGTDSSTSGEGTVSSEGTGSGEVDCAEVATQALDQLARGEMPAWLGPLADALEAELGADGLDYILSLDFDATDPAVLLSDGRVFAALQTAEPLIPSCLADALVGEPGAVHPISPGSASLGGGIPWTPPDEFHAFATMVWENFLKLVPPVFAGIASFKAYTAGLGLATSVVVALVVFLLMSGLLATFTTATGSEPPPFSTCVGAQADNPNNVPVSCEEQSECPTIPIEVMGQGYNLTYICFDGRGCCRPYGPLGSQWCMENNALPNQAGLCLTRLAGCPPGAGCPCPQTPVADGWQDPPEASGSPVFGCLR